MKSQTLLLLLAFGVRSTLADDNFIWPGAKQNGSTKPVVFSATNQGADTFGNPILLLNTSGAAGGATAANQTAVQANPGSDASKAVAVQGVTGGKAVPVSAASLPLPTGAATETTVAAILAKQPATPALEGGNLAALAAAQTAPSRFRSTAQTITVAAVKASAGNLFGYNIVNPNSYPVYVKLYNVAAASVVVGTTVPLRTLAIPSGGYLTQESAGVPLTAFSTAIAVAVTKLLADTDTTDVDTAILCEVFYK